MDLSALHQGVMTALTAVASVTFSIGPAAPQSEVPLTNPEILQSYNLPAEASSKPESLQNLNSITDMATDQLKLVVREVQAEEKVTTVEQPPFTVKQPEVVFTVASPTPKPSVKPSEKPTTQDTEDEPKESEEKSTPKPSASPKSEPEPTSSPKTEIPQSSSNAQILFDLTNEHRSKIGKPAFEKEERLCKIAENRAPMVKAELSNGTLHKGFKDLNLPYWATENLAAYQTMAENFRFLVTDYIHRVAIESDAKYSCTACSGTSCSQIFSSFVPK